MALEAGDICVDPIRPGALRKNGWSNAPVDQIGGSEMIDLMARAPDMIDLVALDDGGWVMYAGHALESVSRVCNEAAYDEADYDQHRHDSMTCRVAGSFLAGIGG